VSMPMSLCPHVPMPHVSMCLCVYVSMSMRLCPMCLCVYVSMSMCLCPHASMLMRHPCAYARERGKVRK